MSDEIRDLDDVEAQAWALAWAHSGCSPKAADECVRLLRERRPSVASTVLVDDAAYRAKCAEHAAIVAWLRSVGVFARVVAAIERGEHER